MTHPYEHGLERNPANYTPLTPVSFLAKAADTYPQRIAVVHGDVRRTWSETYARCRRLAAALAHRGVGRGDTVAAMLPNVPAISSCTSAGDARGRAQTPSHAARCRGDRVMLAHGEAKVVHDREFSATVSKGTTVTNPRPLVVDVDESSLHGGEALGSIEYEALLAEGDRA